MGIVFDIQRCSLHDGPGIRTTVFLKGCPLRCRWCHNPESYQSAPQISFQAGRCTACLTCAGVCENEAHLLDQDGYHIYERGRCSVCGRCISTCPNEALRLIGRDMEVAEVMAEVEADRIFYDRSGGGMTLSGGEPMHQFSFTYNLLATAKSRGIHTVLETCGQSPRARYVQIFPLVDQFLFDYKASDPARHRQLTGVDNTTIIANLNYLLSNDADLVLRCPLIPGINDDDDHLSAIAAWSRRTPGPRQVEIMAYHEMGKEKARQLGGQPLLDDIRTPSETIQRTWLEKLHAYGCHNIVIS